MVFWPCCCLSVCYIGANAFLNTCTESVYTQEVGDLERVNMNLQAKNSEQNTIFATFFRLLSAW